MGYFEPGSSLMTDSGSVLLNLPLIILIIVGGIGFFTWDDIRTHKLEFRKYRVQTKIILLITVVFYVLGMADMLILEWNNSLDGLSVGNKIMASSMLVISGRDAGFAPLDVSLVRPTTTLLLICFMFVGGSPGSTACGIKVTTFAVMILTITSVFKKKKSVECYGRRISDSTVRNACCITTLYVMVVVIGTMLISAVDGLAITPVVFELVSAISSTGLSMGITTMLSDFSLIIVILIMFFGRIGGLSFIVSLSNNHASNKSILPEEKIML
jgi:trk system potassium uptake protein TrkH